MTLCVPVVNYSQLFGYKNLIFTGSFELTEDEKKGKNGSWNLVTTFFLYSLWNKYHSPLKTGDFKVMLHVFNSLCMLKILKTRPIWFWVFALHVIHRRTTCSHWWLPEGTCLGQYAPSGSSHWNQVVRQWIMYNFKTQNQMGLLKTWFWNYHAKILQLSFFL